MNNKSSEFPYTSCPYTCTTSSTINIPSRWYICHSRWPTLAHHSSPLGFTLGIEYSMGFDERIMIYIHHYRIIQSSFTALNILCAPIHPSRQLTPGNHQSFYVLHSFAFSRISYRWDHTVCSLYKLA